MPRAASGNSKPDHETTELTIAELDLASGGRKMEAQLNSGGVNPIVISRDRALG
ncbi:MAG: hypothetical protein PS018_04970 [bacterium]|nr:hypothetical protein [bacterium]